MVSVSKPLSAGKVQEYYKSEFASSVNGHYFTENEKLRGNWEGRLAETFGLAGQQVKDIHFDRLAEGKNPLTGEILVKARDTIRTREGLEVGKRSAWDLTISAPKSVSLAGLVGGDQRIIEAHRQAVKAALNEAENLIQARTGGNNPPETTGKFLVATFDHDTSRPVEKYAAAQLHSHCVLFNMTEDRNGQARSLQTHEIYIAASLITATYQNSLEAELRRLGYKIERGKNHAPEIAGFSPEYLASESKRSKEITDELERRGFSGAEASSIAAHSTRKEKLNQSPEEVKAAHLANAEKFGNQPQQVVAEAAERRARELKPEQRIDLARKAVDFARVKLSERSSVVEHHEILTEALRFVRGKTGLAEIKAELESQKEVGKFVEVSHVRPNAPLWRYTTPEAILDERTVIEAAVHSPQRAPINRISDESLAGRYPQLNEWQRKIIRESLAAEVKITGIQGSAGTGKSTSLSAVRELAEESGWTVQGLAPTSRAARGLKEAGVEKSETIQRFLMREPVAGSGKNLFIVDETSLAAARQMKAVIERLGSSDRMIITGDKRQHSSVEAGRVFEELQMAGLRTARINKLVRQQDQGLKDVVKAMAQGRIAEGVGLLGEQGRITSVPNRHERFAAMAKDYAAAPEGTLVISPDNLSRRELNEAIRSEMRSTGKLGPDAYGMSILVNRQKITGADRALATSYEVGDTVRYRSGSKSLGLEAKSYATVLRSDPDANTVTVKRGDGRTVTYDPAKLKGVSIYEPEIRSFAEGDRVQFTAPSRDLQVSNRDMGTVKYIDGKGNIRIALDEGRTVGFNLQNNKHVEHGFVTTSHASQGATTDKVMVHIDCCDSRIRNLVDQTLAYVALSRPRYEAHVYTDDVTRLATTLNRHKENSTALSPEQIQEYRPKNKGMAA